ncbi:hypothetical protein DPMN_019924 [Dreissena polymorpha]|uniref:Uncharacterized protein n=1 Tax=Dreissena polymorpha TaxID=45954 RepID=A0A9D4NLN3_DREPO|nr:hypothetical protein DPMN_019924 [Dreissena polymorpha]
MSVTLLPPPTLESIKPIRLHFYHLRHLSLSNQSGLKCGSLNTDIAVVEKNVRTLYVLRNCYGMELFNNADSLMPEVNGRS